MKEMKLLVEEKHQFQNEDKSKLTAFYVTFKLSRFLLLWKNWYFLSQIFFYKLKVFDRGRDRKLNPIFLQKIGFQHQRLSVLIAPFGNTSKWGSENDMSQQEFFRNKFVFVCDPGEIRLVKKKLIPKN